jgi:hypothetical protein
MSVRVSTRILLGASALALLSACSGFGQVAPSSAPLPGTPQGASQAFQQPIDSLGVSPDKTPKTLVFGSDNGGQSSSGEAYMYNRSGQNQAPLLTYTSGIKFPWGMYIGAAPAPDLFLANEGDANVLVYGAPDYATLKFTYNDPGQIPETVAQCGNYVYAGNVLNTGGTVGSATAWKLGTAKSSKTVSSVNYQNVTGVACDPTTGDVYVAFLYSYAGPGGIDQYPPGLAGKAKTLGAEVAFPAGIAVDKKGDIAVTEALAGDVELFHPTATTPFQTVTGFESPVAIAFEKSDTIVWVADQGKNSLYRVKLATSAKMDTITKPTFHSLAGAATVPADH